MKRGWIKGFVLIQSIMLIGGANALAKTNEPGPFEKFWRSVKRAFTEPQQPRHKSTHRSSNKQKTATDNSSNTTSTTQTQGSNTPDASASGLGAPNQQNTRTASRATSKKGDDLPYGTPVPGKQGFVMSPFSPNSGYIDVRGFAPGTPVKDPYTGKVFLTP